MSSFNDILNNLKGGLEVQGERAFGTITEAWDSFKNLDSISLPNFDVKNLFGSIAQMTSKFSAAGSGDTKQTDILSGLTSIWTKDSPALQGIDCGENKGTTKYVINNDVVTSGKQYGDPNEMSEEEYNSLSNRGENGKYTQSKYHKVTTDADYTPVKALTLSLVNLTLESSLKRKSL